MLLNIRGSRRCGQGHSRERAWYAASQSRYQECVPECPSAPGRSLVDRHALEGVTLDAALPFGLHSAPKIFTALADAAEWIIQREGVEFIIHYLNDFLLMGRPESDNCRVALDKLLGVFRRLGFPVAPDKLEGPTTRLVFQAGY